MSLAVLCVNESDLTAEKTGANKICYFVAKIVAYQQFRLPKFGANQAAWAPVIDIGKDAGAVP